MDYHLQLCRYDVVFCLSYVLKKLPNTMKIPQFGSHYTCFRSSIKESEDKISDFIGCLNT